LDDVVKGVDIGGKKRRFLRKIPVDPMIWAKRSERSDGSRVGRVRGLDCARAIPRAAGEAWRFYDL
jgi:hypothetical protein